MYSLIRCLLNLEILRHSISTSVKQVAAANGITFISECMKHHKCINLRDKIQAFQTLELWEVRLESHGSEIIKAK